MDPSNPTPQQQPISAVPDSVSPGGVSSAADNPASVIRGVSETLGGNSQSSPSAIDQAASSLGVADSYQAAAQPAGGQASGSGAQAAGQPADLTSAGSGGNGAHSSLQPEIIPSGPQWGGGGVTPPSAPQHHSEKPWYLGRWMLLVAGLIMAGLVGIVGYFGTRPTNQTTNVSSVKSGDFTVTSVPLTDLVQSGQLSIDAGRQLSVNGQLRINNSAVIAPSEAPANPVQGTLYLDKNTSQLMYYDGTKFVAMGATSIGGVAGTLSLGGGLSLVNSTINNSGVITIQGQSGNVNFAAGGGIAINGSTITNTGVLGISGNPNQLAISSSNGSVQISLLGITPNGVLVGGANNGISSVVAPNPGLCLVSSANGPIFDSCTGQATVNTITVGSDSLSGALTLSGGSGISVTHSANTITIANTAAGGNVTAAASGHIAGSIAFFDGTTANIADSALVQSGTSTSTLLTVNAGITLGSGFKFTGDGSGISSLNAGNIATGTLSVARGGTGMDGSSAGNGKLLIGNGSGFTLANLGSSDSTVSITNSAGSIDLKVGGLNQCTGCANNILSNLQSVAINTSLLPASNGVIDLGNSSKAFHNLFLSASAAGSVLKIDTAGLASNATLTINQGGTVCTTTSVCTGYQAAGSYLTSAVTGLNVNGGTLRTNNINLAASTGILINDDGAGNFTFSAPGSGTCGTCADKALSNLQNVAISTSLLPATTGVVDLGDSSSHTFHNIFLSNPTGGKLTVDTNLSSNATVTFNQGGNVCTTSSVCTGYQAAGSYVTSAITSLTVNTGSPYTGPLKFSDTGDVTVAIDGSGNVTFNTPSAGVCSTCAHLASNQTFTGLNSFHVDSNGSNVAFDIQNAAGTSNLFVADTTGGRIFVNQAPTSITDVALQVKGGLQVTAGTVNPVADAAHNGTIYFDSSAGKFKIIEGNTAKVLCNTTDQGCGAGANQITLQGAYDNGDGSITTTDLLDTSSNPIGSKNIAFNLADTTYDGSFLVNILTGSTGRFAVQNAGTDVFGVAGNAVTIDGSLAVRSASGITLGKAGPSGNDGVLVFNNGTNNKTVTLQSGVTAANYTLKLPTAAGSVGECLAYDTGGQLKFQGCLSGSGSGGGVTSLNSLSGAVNITSDGSVAIDDTTVAGSIKLSVSGAGTCSTCAHNLNDAYSNFGTGNPAVISLLSGIGGVKIQDASTPVGGNLFYVSDSTGTPNYFTVTATGISTAGTINNATISGGTLSGGNFSNGTVSGGTLTSAAVNGLNVAGGTVNNMTFTGILSGSGSPTISGFGTINGATLSGGSLTGGTVSGGTLSGGNFSNGTVSGGTLTGTGVSGTGAFGITSGVSADLSLTSGSGKIVLGASTLQRTAAGTMTVELNDSSDTLFSILNTNATKNANLSVEGTINGATITSTTFNGLTIGANSVTAGTSNTDLTLAGNGTGKVAISTALQVTGNIIQPTFTDAASGATIGKYGFTPNTDTSAQLTANTGLPNGVAAICTSTGNCLGSSGGGIASAGGTLFLPIFSSDGYHVVNSLISQDDYTAAGHTPTTVKAGGNLEITKANSAVALKVQTASSSGQTAFTVDTLNNKVIIGDADNSSGANSTLFVVDSATTAKKPTGANGGIYYDTTSNSFQFYENNSYRSLSSTLQQAYSASGTAVPKITVNSTNGGVDVQNDNTSPIASNGSLFAVRKNASSGQGTALFNIDASGNVVFQNTSAVNIFTVDATNGKIGTSNAAAGSANLVIKSGDASAGTAGNLTLDVGSSSSGSGTLNIGDTNARTVNVGNTTAATVLNLQAGTGGVAVTTGAGTTASGGISLTTGAINGASGSSGSISIDSGNATGGGTSTVGNISIGTGAYAHNVTIGNTTGASAATIQSGTGGVTLSSTATTGTGIAMQGNSVTSGNAASIVANALTTGSALSVSSTNNTASLLTSANLVSVSGSQTYTSQTTQSGSLLNIARTNAANIAGGVTYDTSNGNTFGSAASWTIPNYTAGSGGSTSNLVMLVSVEVDFQGATAPSSVTYAGVNLGAPVASNTSNFGISQWFYAKTSPSTASNQSLVVNWGSSTAGRAALSTWAGVGSIGATSQTSLWSCCSGSTTISYNATSTNGDLVVDMAVGVPTITKGAGQTLKNSGTGWAVSTVNAISTSTAISDSGGTDLGSFATSLTPAIPPSLTVTGAVASLSSTCSASQGSCFDSSNILSLNQQYASSTGAVLKIQNAGSGPDIQLGSGIIRPASNSTSAIKIQNASGSSTAFMVDTTNNRVAIGSATVPNYALDVTGDANVTGMYRVGGSQIASSNLSDGASILKSGTTNAWSNVTTFSSTGTGANALNIQGTQDSGTVLALTANSLTAGSALSVSSTSASITSGSLISASHIATYVSPLSDNGNLLNLNRNITSNATISTPITLGGTPITQATNSAPNITFNFNAGNETNRVVIVSVFLNNCQGTMIGATATYGGVAMTRKVTSTFTGDCYGLFTLNSSVPTGNNNVVISGLTSNAGSPITRAVAMYFYNVAGLGNFAANSSYATGSLSNNPIASAVGRTIVDTVITVGGGVPATSAPQTVIASGVSYAVSTTPGAASVTTTWSGTTFSSGGNGVGGIELLPLSYPDVAISGSLATLSSTCSAPGPSTCTDTSNLLSLNQQYASSTGAVLKIQNAGSGPDIQLGSGIIRPASNSTSAIKIQNASGSSTAFMVDTTNNRVAIGSATVPNYALDVTGDANVTGMYRVGGSQIASSNLSDGASLVKLGSSASGSSTTTLSQTNTTTTGILVQGSQTTAAALSITANALTTGNGLSVTSSSSSLSSANLVSIATTGTYTTPNNVSGNNLNMSRALTSSVSGAITSMGATNASPTTNSSGVASYTSSTASGRTLVIAARYTGPFVGFSSVYQDCDFSATYGGVAMTSLGKATNQAWGSSFIPEIQVFGLATTASGGGTVQFTSSLGSFCQSITLSVQESYWTNVDPSAPFGTVQTNTGTGTLASVSATNVSGNVMYAAFAGEVGAGNSFGTNQTQIGGSNSTLTTSYKTATTPTSESDSYSSQQWSVVAVPLQVQGLTVSGAVASISNSCSGSGPCRDASSVLNINQQYASASGSVVNVQNAGTGITAAFSNTNATSNGPLISLQNSNSSAIDIQLGSGKIQTAATNGASLNSNGVSLMSGNATGATSSSGSITIQTGTGTTASGSITIKTGNAPTAGSITVDTGTSTSGSVAINIGTAAAGGTATKAITIGNLTDATTQFLVKSGSTTAFQIQATQNATTQSLFNVDTQNSIVTVGSATADVTQSWGSTTNMLSCKQGSTVEAYQGYLFSIGGSTPGTCGSPGAAPYNGAAVTGVDYARLNVDGTIAASGVGAWASESNALPEARYLHASTVVNGYLFVIGGQNSASTNGQSTVYRSKINSDGTLGAWATNSAGLPGNRYALSAVTANGYIYAIGGNNDAGTAQNTIYYGKVDADGRIASWSSTTINGGSAVARSYHSSVVANGYLYVIGGCADGGCASGQDQATVYSAKIAADGSLSGWTQGTSLPTTLHGHSSVVLNGNIYTIGGMNNVSFPAQAASVRYSRINTDGTMSTWNTASNGVPSTPTNLISQRNDSVAYNGYIYTLGGFSAGSSVLNKVEYAGSSRVKVNGALDLVGTSGDDNSEGQTGGQLTAGNTNIVGTLDVRDQANFAQGVSVTGALNVGGGASIYKATSTATDDLLRILSDVTSTGNPVLAVKANGDLYTDGANFIGSGADLAENYSSTQSLKPGDVVTFTGGAEGTEVVKSTDPYQAALAGVISSDPSLTISSKTKGYPLALAGRIPVNVTDENGEIKAGDYLTSSSTPGKAMKATTTGPILGRALTGLDSGSGSVLMFVANGYFNPTSGTAMQGNADLGDINVANVATINTLVVTGSATFKGNIIVNGHFVTGGGLPTVTAKAGLGTGADVQIEGNDTAGEITITAGSGVTAGDIVDMVFSKPFGKAPHVLINPANAEAADVNLYRDDSTGTGVTIGSKSNLEATKVYKFDYFIVE